MIEDTNPTAGFSAATTVRPIIVCLCGSTKFRSAFEQANWQETAAGLIVLSVGCYMHHDAIPVTPEQKAVVDDLHFRKIKLADEVLVLNVGGYIGDSTRREINHARELGQPLRWLEPDKAA